MARILIVDDDRITLVKLKAMLEHENHEVFIATDGIYVEEILQDTQPDLLITDIIMPQQHGLETIIQVIKGYPDLPILTMSGDDLGENLLDVSVTLGATDSLKKPIDKNDLLNKIKKLVR